MSDDQSALDAAIAAVAPRIPQPVLRPLAPNERIVRTAGLKFILPMNWKPGDVLDEQSAAMLNTAFCTIVINRFAPIRQALLENPNCTYDDLDSALQGHFENFQYNPRPIDSSQPQDARTDEERALEAFARPFFNKAVGGKGVPRKDYEALLREFVSENREMLADLKKAADARQSSLLAEFESVFGSDD